MARLVADYAFDRPSLSALKAAGVEGVARYLSPMPNGKVLNTNPNTEQFDGAEMAELARLGMSLVTVWETTASRATAGFLAGANDATRANDQADLLGIPADRPLYYAVDSDVPYADVKAYFDGARSVGRREVGIYGSYRVCVAAQADSIRWLWQTVAWSYGALLPSAHLYQRNFHSVSVPGGWDENVVLQSDWGQFTPGASRPTPAPVPEEDQMAVRYALPNGQVYVTDGLSRRYVGSPLDNDVLNDLGVKLVPIAADHIQAFHDGLHSLDGPAVDINALASLISSAINVKVDATTIGAAVAKVLGSKLSA